jgi:hypothetical protein
MRAHTLWIPLIGIFAAGASGCVAMAVNSPVVQGKLQLVSAGYTGCMPGENVLSNVAPNADGSGIWNATCKDKVYLCTAVSSVEHSMSFHCAPVAQ